MKLFKRKKGFVGDFFLYMIMIFVLGLSILLIYYAISTINTGWQGIPGVSGQPKTIMQNFNDRFVNVWDSWFLLLAIGFFITILILAFALRSHPVFAMLAILVIIIMGVIAVHFANAYTNVAGSAGLVDISSQFVFMTFIQQNLPFIVLILGAIFVIVLFAKTRTTNII